MSRKKIGVGGDVFECRCSGAFPCETRWVEPAINERESLLRGCIGILASRIVSAEAEGSGMLFAERSYEREEIIDGSAAIVVKSREFRDDKDGKNMSLSVMREYVRLDKLIVAYGNGASHDEFFSRESILFHEADSKL